MSDDDPGEKRPDEDRGSADAERARRRAQVFGEVLPDTTTDERAGADDDAGREGGADEWLRANVPPHHGS